MNPLQTNFCARIHFDMDMVFFVVVGGPSLPCIFISNNRKCEVGSILSLSLFFHLQKHSVFLTLSKSRVFFSLSHLFVVK